MTINPCGNIMVKEMHSPHRKLYDLFNKASLWIKIGLKCENLKNESEIQRLYKMKVAIDILFKTLLLNTSLSSKKNSGRWTQNYTDGQTDSSDLVEEPPRAGRRCTRCSSPGGTARRRWWPRGSWSVSPARWCCPRPRLPASPSRGCPSGSLGPAPGGRNQSRWEKGITT